jgi:aflatoxin B1 aldehyde reductase
MTFGEEGKEQARVHNLEDIKAILDVFQRHGHDEVRHDASASVRHIRTTSRIETRSDHLSSNYQIDTARVYGHGTSEEYLGKLRWKERGLKMATKLYSAGRLPGAAATMIDPITHKAEDLKKYLRVSLEALGAEYVPLPKLIFS